MNPTRPLDPNKTLRPLGQKALGPAKEPVSAQSARPSNDPGGGVSVDVASIGFGRAEARHLDSQRIEALRRAIEEDRYDVDPDALAKRIVDDAIGAEAFE